MLAARARSASDRPSVLALTRQNLPQLRQNLDDEQPLRRRRLRDRRRPTARPQVSIFATGSEVAIAVEAQKLLAAQGIAARVVSVPCFELFAGSSRTTTRRAVIGDAPVKVGVEAAVRQGWDAIIGTDGVFVGMNASAPARPTRTSTSISASPPRRSPRRR